MVEELKDCHPDVSAFDTKNLGKDIDLVIVIGGDGTLLHLNSLFQGLSIFGLFGVSLFGFVPCFLGFVIHFPNLA